jgi:hypothetical protein
VEAEIIPAVAGLLFAAAGWGAALLTKRAAQRARPADAASVAEASSPTIRAKPAMASKPIMREARHRRAVRRANDRQGTPAAR